MKKRLNKYKLSYFIVGGLLLIAIVLLVLYSFYMKTHAPNVEVFLQNSQNLG